MARMGHHFRSSQGRRKSKRNRKVVHKGHIVRHNHRRYAGVRGGTRNGKRATLRKAHAKRLTHLKRRPGQRRKPIHQRHATHPRRKGVKRHLTKRKLTRHLHRHVLRRHARRKRHLVHHKRGLHRRRRILHAIHRRHGYHVHRRHGYHIHRRHGLKHPHKGWHGHHKITHKRQSKKATPAQHFQGFELTSYESMFGG